MYTRFIDRFEYISNNKGYVFFIVGLYFNIVIVKVNDVGRHNDTIYAIIRFNYVVVMFNNSALSVIVLKRKSRFYLTTHTN